MQPGKAWRNPESRYPLTKRKAKALLSYLRLHGELTENELRTVGVVHLRRVMAYLVELVKAGLITKTRERHLCTNGKRQPFYVLRVATEIPHVVAAADPALWDHLRPTETVPSCTLTLAELLG